MAYTKKTWVSGETPCSSENFNHMEQGIADAHNKLDELNTKITKRAIINCSAVSSLRNDIGLQIGGHYAEITPDYSGINGNILSTSLIMLGTDQTQDGVLTSHTVLASMVGKSGKIDKIGVITTGVLTVRAKISVTYQ